MLEDPFYDEEEARDVRAHWRRLAVRLVVGAVIVFALGGAIRKAFSAADVVQVDCRALAETIDAVADFRDTGARLELVLALLSGHSSDGPAERAVLEREIRRLWREGLAGEDAAAAVFKRCKAQLGDMGRES